MKNKWSSLVSIRERLWTNPHHPIQLHSRVYSRDDPGGLAQALRPIKSTRCGQGLALALDGPVGEACLDPVGIGV